MIPMISILEQRSFVRSREMEMRLGEDEDNNSAGRKVFWLCVQCGEVSQSKPVCGHDPQFIRVVKGETPEDEDRADQLAKCDACGYTAAGRDPVREVVHGTDGPHAVIATTLYRVLPEGRKRFLPLPMDVRRQHSLPGTSKLHIETFSVETSSLKLHRVWIHSRRKRAYPYGKWRQSYETFSKR